MERLTQLETGPLFLVSILVLLAATQLVVYVLGHLEKRRLGSVQLGTIVTPLCTGFPNLMIGLFGQERLQGDLVLQLNIGNNIANTSLVCGVLLFLAGPLVVRAGKGKSKKAVRTNRDQWMTLLFLWLATALTVYLAMDGDITRQDGMILTSYYLMVQAHTWSRRDRATKKQQMSTLMGLYLMLLLVLAAWGIQQAVNLMGLALDRVESLLPGGHLGLFLGLLTVVPESFLLLRLASRQGSLGLNGLVGDCLVSIPLVIGLSSMIYPISTTAITSITDVAARPYLCLAVTLAYLRLLGHHPNACIQGHKK